MFDEIMDSLCKLNDREFDIFKLTFVLLLFALGFLVYGVHLYYDSVARRDAYYVEAIKNQQEIDSRIPSPDFSSFQPHVIYYDSLGSR